MHLYASVPWQLRWVQLLHIQQHSFSPTVLPLASYLLLTAPKQSKEDKKAAAEAKRAEMAAKKAAKNANVDEDGNPIVETCVCLPPAYRLPPTTYCLPPTVYRLPPTAHHLLLPTYHLPPNN